MFSLIKYKTFNTTFLDFWLGGTDNGVEGSWKWWSGTSFTYTKWNPGEPNDNTNANGYIQDYVMTNSNGWFDHESHNAVNYICEREGKFNPKFDL